MKKWMIICIVIILTSVIAFVAYKKISNKKKEKEIIENQIIQNQIEISEKEANYVQEDQEKPEEIQDINITDEQKVLACLAYGTFNNSGVLSDEDMLKIVYNLLDSNIIKVNNDSVDTGKVDDITYSLFNRKLNSYVSIDNMNYENGKYTISRKNSNIGKLENNEISAAMGSIYMTCDYNGNHYTIKFATNTLTGEKYIQSIN